MTISRLESEYSAKFEELQHKRLDLAVIELLVSNVTYTSEMLDMLNDTGIKYASDVRSLAAELFTISQMLEVHRTNEATMESRDTMH